MEIHEHTTVIYEFTSEEATIHFEVLAKVYQYLNKAGHKTFNLTTEQFDHLKYYIDKFETDPPQEVIIQAETATVTRETDDYSYEKRNTKNGNKKRGNTKRKTDQ